MISLATSTIKSLYLLSVFVLTTSSWMSTSLSLNILLNFGVFSSLASKVNSCLSMSVTSVDSCIWEVIRIEMAECSVTRLDSYLSW